MPKTTALYMGRTAPLLPVIIIACMGGVFAFQHYNAEGYIADIVDKTKAEIETVVQKTTSESEPLPEQSGTLTVQPTGTPRTSTSLIERDTEGVVPPHTGNTPEVSTDDTPEVSTDDTPEVFTDDTPEVFTDDTPEVFTDDTPEVFADDTPEVFADDTPEVTADDTELPGVELSGISAKVLEKKTYDILHLLVGKYPKGESLSSMFTETVVNLTQNKETGRKAIVDSMNRFMSNFPVRAVKLTSVGINGLRLEINTRRIFVHQNGERLDAYGKTTVLLDEKQRITCISDDVQEGEPTTLSPGFKPISYTLKSTISNKTKKKSR